jgi:SAM-dependent methyltransferase
MSSPIQDISHLLHDSRSARLRKMPKFEGTMLSAGCAGTWYFNWIRERTGHVGRHIGIEFYSPKPTDLPANVEWIANTVGDMNAVASGTCELVFSGENLEHLWPEDVVGFFLESWRVLQPGGHLVIDSPNRLVTEPYVWSHPEHTVEVTPAEAKTLAELAGFEVTAVKGIWLCRDPATKRLLPLDPNTVDAEWPLVERVLSAEDDPDNSFIWWLEAVKHERGPDPKALTEAMDAIFAAAWPERSKRFVQVVGDKVEESGTVRARAKKGTSGVIVYGPYMPLKKGPHSATFQLSAAKHKDQNAILIRCDILGSGGREIVKKDISSADLAASGGKITLEFELAELEFGIQARCISFGANDVECALPVIIV